MHGRAENLVFIIVYKVGSDHWESHFKSEIKSSLNLPRDYGEVFLMKVRLRDECYCHYCLFLCALSSPLLSIELHCVAI